MTMAAVSDKVVVASPRVEFSLTCFLSLVVVMVMDDLEKMRL